MSNDGSGGGGFLWVADLISTGIRNRKINKYNRVARGVSSARRVSVSELFPQSSSHSNIIVSGGDVDEHLLVCEQLLKNSYALGIPVIVLHTSNTLLEGVIGNGALGYIANSPNKIFDAFTSFDYNEIVNAVLEVGRERYDIKPSGRFILQVVYELLQNKARKPYFSAFAHCPYFQLSDQIVSRMNNGTITQSDANRLDSLLLTGQSEIAKIDSFFHDMQSQIGYISAPNPAATGAVGILSAIKNGQILSVDLRSSSNTMFIDMIALSLGFAMNRGYGFTLLIDNVSLISNEKLKNIILQGGGSKIIVANDLYALSGGNNDLFAALIAQSDKTVLFSHASGLSCEKWSSYIGEYDKIDVSFNSHSGWHKSSRWGYNMNSGQTESLKREPKIKPEEINGLGPYEGIVYDHNSQVVLHTILSR